MILYSLGKGGFRIVYEEWLQLCNRISKQRKLLRGQNCYRAGPGGQSNNKFHFFFLFYIFQIVDNWANLTSQKKDSVQISESTWAITHAMQVLSSIVPRQPDGERKNEISPRQRDCE